MVPVLVSFDQKCRIQIEISSFLHFPKSGAYANFATFANSPAKTLKIEEFAYDSKAFPEVVQVVRENRTSKDTEES